MTNDISEIATDSLKQEMARRYKTERFRYYTPNGAVEDFIRLIGFGKYFIVLLSAANGIGKTAVGVNILANMFWPGNNEFFKLPMFQEFPFPKKFRIISDPTTIKQATIPEMYKWFPQGRFTTSKHGKPYEYSWKTDTGWEGDIMSFDQDIKEFESTTLGLAWLDEPPPKEVFKATVSRMRTGGLIFITETPLTGSAWIYDEIINNPNNEDGYRTFIEADVEVACKVHGLRGHLEHDHIEKMVSQYDDEDKQARIFGKFQHLTGLVFKKFDPQIHVIKPFEIDPKDFIVLELLDPHTRTPDAVLWVARHRDGRYFVVDEMFMSCDNTAELSRRIKNKGDEYRIIGRYADPSAFNENKHEDLLTNSTAKKLADSGLYYKPAPKRRSDADRKIRDALHFVKRDGSMIKPPELYIFDHCKQLIWELQHLQWQNYYGKAKDRKSLPDKPQDKDDHLLECLGRALVLNPQWTPYDPNPVRIISSHKVGDPYA